MARKPMARPDIYVPPRQARHSTDELTLYCKAEEATQRLQLPDCQYCHPLNTYRNVKIFTLSTNLRPYTTVGGKGGIGRGRKFGRVVVGAGEKERRHFRIGNTFDARRAHQWLHCDAVTSTSTSPLLLLLTHFHFYNFCIYSSVSCQLKNNTRAWCMHLSATHGYGLLPESENRSQL
jgi:hypothetical protein